MRTNEELALMVKQGDREATEQLWKQTEKLITKLASRYFKLGKALGFEPDDILQEGFIALLKAVKYYNPAKGIVFTSYLHNCIKMTLFADMGVSKRHKLPPTPASLYEQIAGVGSPIYLVDVLADGAAFRDMEQVEDDIYLSQLREVLKPGLDALDERGREVLNGRYYKGETCAQIGQKFGVTRQTVHDKEKKCLRKFQAPEYLQRLKTFLYP